MSWIADLPGYRSVISTDTGVDVELPNRRKLRFEGALATDDANGEYTNIAFKPTAGNGALVGTYQTITRQNHKSTVDATPVILDAYAIPNVSQIAVRGLITVYNSVKGSSILFTGGARRNGTAISVMNSATSGLTYHDFGAEGASATSVALTVASNEFRVTFTGEAATNYEIHIVWEILVWTAP
jgi:hypothetical protein